MINHTYASVFQQRKSQLISSHDRLSCQTFWRVRVRGSDTGPLRIRNISINNQKINQIINNNNESIINHTYATVFQLRKSQFI